MQKSEIEIGNEYAVREARSGASSFQHVRVLQHVRTKKWKVEWIEPNPGLVGYVDSQALIVRWADREAFLRDEDHDRQLLADNDRVGYQEDSPLTNAVDCVIDALGEERVSLYRGVLSGAPSVLARVKERLRLDPARFHPLAYVDRHGAMHLPFSEALELARAFCAVEPNTVLLGIEATEKKWEHQASRSDDGHMVRVLNRYRAAWAIVRQWTGHDPAIAARENQKNQIQRLERLLWDAIYILQQAGLDQDAHRLRRALPRS